MTQELSAAFSAEIVGSAPEWIMYAPAGTHMISASVDGKPSRVKITVTPEAAAALQADLEARKASGGPQPFFDLHHEARDATAYPEEFQWRPDGIFARVTWTPSGLAATKSDPENGVLPSVRYFSPRCAISGGKIVGLLDPSRGNAAGGLVSDPAFTRIALVAGKTTNPTTPMDPLKMRLMKMLGAEDGMEMEDDELMSKLEAMCAPSKKAMKAAKEVEDLTATKAAIETERDGLKAELTAAKEALEAARMKAADSFVAELVASGKVPPKAEARKEFLRKSYLSDPDGTIAYASELTASNPGSERITEDAKNNDEGDKGALRQAKASELQAGKKDLSWEAAWEAACILIP